MGKAMVFIYQAKKNITKKSHLGFFLNTNACVTYLLTQM